MKPIFFINTLIVLLFIFICCFFVYQDISNTSPKHVTLKSILNAGEITVITHNNAQCYYLYQDRPMGFEYELAKAFADYLKVKLKIKIAEKWDEMIPAIMAGEGDFIAAGLTIMPEREKMVAFSDGYLSTCQHIIVHRDNMNLNKVDDLAGKTVDVRKKTSYHKRLEEIKKQGIDLNIKLHEDLTTEELIRQVAEKKIEITIADTNIALLNRRYHPQIAITCRISDDEYLGWAANQNSVEFLEIINQYFSVIKKNGTFTKIYDKYYKSVDTFDYVDLRAFHRRLKTRLPKYISIIKQEAKTYNFDWRLIAAQIYQESHLNPRARSHAGASGLMQLTRSTARSLGINDILDPEQNIYAGVKHLNNLYALYDKAVASDRLFIALAAYNIGQGHVKDARNLAKKMELDPNQWSSLKKTLPLLSRRKYYRDATYGYCRGAEPVKYINQIMIYYDILKSKDIKYEISS